MKKEYLEYRAFKCKCGRYTFRKDYRSLSSLLGWFDCEHDVSFRQHQSPAFYPM